MPALGLKNEESRHKVPCISEATKERADEPTRIRSLQVIKGMLLGFARACKSGISKLVPFLCPAPCCTLLLSQWCRKLVQSKESPRRDFLKAVQTSCVVVGDSL
jgi:hypothetical protein